jgi:hypothetical protein
MNEQNQFKGVNSIKFYQAFSTDEDCYRYLADVKWSDTEISLQKMRSYKILQRHETILKKMHEMQV